MSEHKENHYVNNKQLTEAMAKWVATFEEGKPRSPMPDYVGLCLMKMVEKYGRKYRFSGYTYLDEMQSEALLTAVKYAHNFKPEKSNNAFAYFTQIIHNAFIQFINSEKKLANLKFEMVKELNPKIGRQDWHDIKLDDSSHSEQLPAEFLK